MPESNYQLKRNPVFDLLKITLTVLVLNIHARIIIGKTQPNFLENYVWYAVPLFIVLSFFLTGKIFFQEKPKPNNLYKRLIRLALPFIFWSGVGFLVRPELFSASNLVIQLFTGQVVNLPLYYLVLLMWYIFICWSIGFLPRRIRPLVYLAIIIIAFVVEYSRMSYLFFNPLDEAIKKSYGRFVELSKYAFLGLLFANFIEFTKDKTRYILYTTVISLLLYSVFLFFGEPPGFHYSGLGLFASTSFIFSLVLWLSRQQFALAKNHITEALGKYSFGVYLFHFSLLEFTLKILPQIKSFIDMFPMIFLILYMVGCYLLCFLIDWLTRKKFSFLIQ